MELSLLLLTTPIMPAPPPPGVVPRPPIVDGAAGEIGVVPMPRPPVGPAPAGPGAGARPPIGPAAVSRPPIGPVEESRPLEGVCPPGAVGCWTVWPGVAAPEPEMPAPPCWPAGTGWKSSLVIGSLNFLRRKRSRTRTSTLGGKLFAYLRENKVIAWTYCCPRNTSSSSFSRWAACFHTGMATVIITAMMPRVTSRAAMAYPCSQPIALFV
jgi:hypothetical protein